MYLITTVIFKHDAENLQPQSAWGDRTGQDKDLLSRNCMSDMRPFSATDCQSESD